MIQLREKSLLRQLRSSEVQDVLRRYEAEAHELMASRARSAASAESGYDAAQVDEVDDTGHSHLTPHPATSQPPRTMVPVSPFECSRSSFAAFLPPSCSSGDAATSAGMCTL